VLNLADSDSDSGSAVAGCVLMAGSLAVLGLGIVLATAAGSDALYAHRMYRYENAPYNGGWLPPPHWVIRTFGVCCILAGCTGALLGFFLLVHSMARGQS
jgi:hypothetical protein